MYYFQLYEQLSRLHLAVFGPQLYRLHLADSRQQLEGSAEPAGRPCHKEDKTPVVLHPEGVGVGSARASAVTTDGRDCDNLGYC